MGRWSFSVSAFSVVIRDDGLTFHLLLNRYLLPQRELLHLESLFEGKGASISFEVVKGVAKRIFGPAPELLKSTSFVGNAAF